ncbi:ABC transporter ATP-binding protein [Desulfospira joergensenii]|uniref:ABC transporter ATP-binding protein n=1 Tax=Desulfospira joergensenii TaxID=53329 RepID=UPI0003B56DCB|nr:ABC transporter ATP-binding protein [Desulfospira joergensenii]
MKRQDPILYIEGLTTHFFSKTGVVKAVDGVSFSVSAGEIFGIVGESGSGKTLTGLSVLGLVPPPGKIIDGSIHLNGIDLTGMDASGLRRLRGMEMAMIFQDAMTALNPVLRVDTQVIEAIRAHRPMPRHQALKEAAAALAQVGIPAPEERLRAYPHQFSGGMRQRLAIALAMINSPGLIIADEPTTALDVTIQAQILSEVQKLSRSKGTAIVWITHDLTVVAGLADRIGVMYAGRLVETGTTDDVLDNPLHPYTRGLIGSIPSRTRRGLPLAQIPGSTPSLDNLPAGCAFIERCSRARTACRENPAMAETTPGHQVRCHFPGGELP